MRYRIEIRSGLLRPGSALGGFEAETTEDGGVTSVEVADRAQLRSLIRRIDELGGEILRLRMLAPDTDDGGR
jgi:hypothetical protein